MVDDFVELRAQAGQVFTPGSPVNEQELFSGRVEQLQRIVDAVNQKGYHAALYGERGVGKTSLANILTAISKAQTVITSKTICDASDDYATLWRKAFSEITYSRLKQGFGFNAEQEAEITTLADMLRQDARPEDVRRIIASIGTSARILFVFDEFDRVSDRHAAVLMSDTIKSFSDYGLNATILVIGVASSVETLLEGHNSIERAVVQIPMPRMSGAEISQIVANGMTRLGLQIEDTAKDDIQQLSQGLPYITHLLALHSCQRALEREDKLVRYEDIRVGIQRSLDQWQHSVRKAYSDATQSAQPGNIYKQVLLSCALAEADEMGFFAAAALRRPLKLITSRDYDIPNYAQHLKNFTDDTRGPILEMVGSTRRRRYRFISPLHRPYITIRGVSEGMITPDQIRELSA
ncbi:ATP-binding protein [Cereibacter sphaeroides]|uniref:ATP-binding protein n=1 Tax=Cereibacter sphaeroides TaxID=1063 RepID=UPI001F450D75|nr:ATP-binding protein [Cereibacter sphaeroides]MCE6959989.1 ATP-binding protein [Cereibacter sphaeroides]MCE6973074.1 ATP-binding protein [Cereibacter sphaeroides]